jgi:hypothetical protein
VVSNSGTMPTIQASFIGTDLTSNLARPNSSEGILLEAPALVQGNFISGNGDPGLLTGRGILIGPDAGGTIVRGNGIGIGGGGLAVPNGYTGITVSATSAVFIGGTNPSDRNTISGNTFVGIEIHQAFPTPAQPSGTEILGNYVGTDQAGLAGIPNGEWGIRVIGGNHITIGGTSAGSGNVIAFNGGSGLLGFNGGVDVIGDTASAVTIRGNRIEQNTGLGIDLNTDGVTPNDLLLLDADTGPNGRQNFPSISAIVNAATTLVTGTLDSSPNTTFEVDAYSGPSCDATGFGEGRTYVGSFTLVTDGAGLAPFGGQSLGALVASGQFITLVASGPGGSSEFSGCVVVP